MKISDEILKELKFDDKGLLTAIAQDFKTNEILMVAFMNLEALLKTIETEKAHYYSRSRAKQWLKGESSGHIQIVHEMYIDCDADAVVMKVEQIAGGACHTGYRSCFYRTIDGNIVGEKVFNPEDVY
ncbi:MAG: phosphoribosyl-AMP cyclohydrolase [Methanosarcinales archaeon]|nr:phosphoribosyl-AMP cyclohydrolase [Methanosarcinales archaeon]